MEELPDHFRPLQIVECMGSSELKDHLGCFENAALLHWYTDGVKCCVFFTTFVGSAQRWFNQFPPNSIQSFGDFNTLFLQHFASSKRYYKIVISLFTIKQWAQETLCNDIRRFNKAALEVSSSTPEILLSSFSQGLCKGEFFLSLVKNPPSSYEALLGQAKKYIHVEEAQQSWKGDRDPGVVACPKKKNASGASTAIGATSFSTVIARTRG